MAIAILMAMVLAGGQATAVPPAAPSAEAEALGVKLAANGVLAILLPTMTDREIGEIADAHPELSAAENDQWLATGRRIADDAVARAATRIGHQYAMTLSLDDLRALVAFNASPPAQHWRAAEPAAIMTAAQALDGFDFKGTLTAEFCKATGKLCGGKK
ncbi:MAG: DUF2059 domain-containing protein [Sphingomonas sp.]|uniref:DUF2059 domain-containing protein n=1 Tax=Sphingomonas sp. TaxID=28214 RepID=UPI003F7E1B51